MLIPFNYKDKLDNNIIYNLNTKKRESILKNEKKYYNKIQPFNQRILTSGYNKNLDGFLKDHETPIEYKRNCKNYQLFGKELCNKDNIKSIYMVLSKIIKYTFIGIYLQIVLI